MGEHQKVTLVKQPDSSNANAAMSGSRMQLVALHDIAKGEPIAVRFDDGTYHVVHVLRERFPRGPHHKWSHVLKSGRVATLIAITACLVLFAFMSVSTKDPLLVSSAGGKRSPWSRHLSSKDAATQLEKSTESIHREIESFTNYVLSKISDATFSPSECSYVTPVAEEYAMVERFAAAGNVAGVAAPSSRSASPYSSPEVEKQRRLAASLVWTFSQAIPTTINSPPISFGAVNISEPFGAWMTSFFPVEDLSDAGGPPENLRYPQMEDPAPPLYALVTRNAYITAGQTQTCDGYRLFAGGCVSDQHYVDDGHLVASSEQFDIIVPFCSSGCVNYYHFVHEQLPRLMLARGILTAKTSHTIRLLLPGGTHAFMWYYLVDILEIPKERITWGHGGVIGRQVVYPMTQRCGSTSLGLVTLMRDVVFRRLDIINGSTVADGGANQRLRFVFSERSDLSRMPKNYHILKENITTEFFDQLHFDTVVNEDVPKQINAFRRADIVLGPHGANLANMIWMRKGSHLIEMMSSHGSQPRHTNGNMCYYNVAGRVGVHHHMLLHPTGDKDTYTLEYDEVRVHILHALRQLRG